MKTENTDLVVIGGGPAGMLCAIRAAERGVGTVILDGNRLLGRKLRITGKGRCNVTNNCDVRTVMQNIPGDGRFLYSSLSRFGPGDTMAFFATCREMAILMEFWVISEKASVTSALVKV